MDDKLELETKYIMSFLIDSTRYGLNEQDAFEFLIDKNLSNLPWVVLLGIKHVTEKDGEKLPHLKKLAKKIQKSTRNNQGLTKSLQDLYEKPIVSNMNLLRNKIGN